MTMATTYPKRILADPGEPTASNCHELRDEAQYRFEAGQMSLARGNVKVLSENVYTNLHLINLESQLEVAISLPFSTISPSTLWPTRTLFPLIQSPISLDRIQYYYRRSNHEGQPLLAKRRCYGPNYAHTHDHPRHLIPSRSLKPDNKRRHIL